MKLLLVHVDQCAQTHVDNSLSLDIIQVEALAQTLTRLVGCRRRTDNFNHFVDIVRRHNQTFDNMRAVLCLLNQETCAADNDIMPVVDKRLQQLLEVEQLRTAFNERYIVDAER